MATARRVFWESAIVIAFLAILVAVILWSSGRVDRHAKSLSAQHEQALSAADQRHQDEIEELRRTWDELSEARTRAQAKAVLAAFEAGIHEAAASRWGRYLDRAKDALVAQPAVSFVHLATPQGRVISTSDDELAASGRLDERGDWALASEGIVSRDGDSAGMIELAAPVVENGRTVAVLWIGYDLNAVTTSSSGAR